MSFAFEVGHDPEVSKDVSIKVIGIGGGGGNAVRRMVAGGVTGVEFIAINTDKQVLGRSDVPVKLQIGEKITKGLGAGSKPEIGKKAAEESEEEISHLLEGAEMVYITAGMGGGTGTGAAPVIAKLAKDMGILTVGIVTRPFEFEGMMRIKHAEEGIAELRGNVDALLVIPNERLKYVSDQKITFQNAFEIADNVLRQAIQSISELITVPGLINLDFADVKTIMKDAGFAHMGVGRASGKTKATDAAKMAIQSPLLETSINGARGVILNITASPDIGLEEVEEAASMVRAAAHKDAHIIFGAAIDENLDDELHITVVATGFDDVPGSNISADLEEIVADIQNHTEEKISKEVEAEERSSETAAVENTEKTDAASKITAEEEKIEKENNEIYDSIEEIFKHKKDMAAPEAAPEIEPEPVPEKKKETKRPKASDVQNLTFEDIGIGDEKSADPGDEPDPFEEILRMFRDK
ncbi:MAG: cell division protein FtsZ [Clostridia bacterium]|nr:cell division protein FtsZ [Clostridia bacterium]